MPLRILLIEDEPDVCEVVEFALSIDPDILLKSCGSGQEALPLASDWAPTGILLDVRMPGMDGCETLDRLLEKPETAIIPVIFFTALVQSQDLETYRALPIAGIIQKPFDPMTLAATVRSTFSKPHLADAQR